MDRVPIVRLDKVSKRYPGEPRAAVAEVSLAVFPGDFLAITGPSGAGKSTLLHILGLLDRPTTGEVLISEQETTRLSESTRANLRNKFLGFVFQFHFLLPDLTVLENVMLPLLIASQSSLRARRTTDRKRQQAMQGKAETMLEAVGLQEKASRFPYQLSGGERQRVAVARALAASPQLILADEPTGNLDSKSALLIWQLLGKVNQTLGTAIVAVTHNEELARQANCILHCVDGKIVSWEGNESDSTRSFPGSSAKEVNQDEKAVDVACGKHLSS